jgi:MFS family permease
MKHLSSCTPEVRHVLNLCCCCCCCCRVVASCFALIHDKTSFFVLRLLLGLFEAGATPAMWYSLSQFYPQERCGASAGQCLLFLGPAAPIWAHMLHEMHVP